MSKPVFTFIDLFAGIGGFHAVLSSMGGKCVYAAEIDKDAAKIYQENWGIDPLHDVTADANDDTMNIPPHDVLCAGFPCQPFSKSGAQKGMEETRGTLYWNILKIIETRKPKLVLLENVRNIAGPRHGHEWNTIIRTLREQGYLVSETPTVFSPHLLPPALAGRPQIRERVYITATLKTPELLGKEEEEQVPNLVSNMPVDGWDPKSWNIVKHLPAEKIKKGSPYLLREEETLWIEAWDELVRHIHQETQTSPPSFPLWADSWGTASSPSTSTMSLPAWKRNIIDKNQQFYLKHKNFLDMWTKKWGIYTSKFPPSRRKLEWQAQGTPTLWGTIMHFRPSGIRAKAPTYVPALVAINQTSILGAQRRKLTPRETARLQGFPDWFTFAGQKDSATYKQTGNGVNIGALWFILKKHAERDKDILQGIAPELYDAIVNAPDNPDLVLAEKKTGHGND